MFLRQKSAFNGFSFEFLDDHRARLGDFSYAWFAQAKNARLRAYSDKDAARGDIQMSLLGRSWRIRHLYLNRRYLSDIRYTLETADETIHAQVDVLANTAGQRLPRIVMTHPIPAELGISSRWLKKRFSLIDSATDQPMGCIREPSVIATRRELLIDLPGLEPPVAAFLGIVALIVRY